MMLQVIIHSEVKYKCSGKVNTSYIADENCKNINFCPLDLEHVKEDTGKAVI